VHGNAEARSTQCLTIGQVYVTLRMSYLERCDFSSGLREPRLEKQTRES
jgi:hypothetical protein